MRPTLVVFGTFFPPQYCHIKGKLSPMKNSKTHNAVRGFGSSLYKLCRGRTSGAHVKLHNVTLTLIQNLYLLDEDPSVGCLQIFAATKLLLIINSGAAVL